MTRKILVADLLCGAGGSSTGCERALKGLGLEMDLVCVNHWPTAIETHTKNHPTARHFVQDIATVRPAELVPELRLDLLMASPTCTHHSVARGGKPTSDQQRSDPWHIIAWLTELRVKRIIIENVWEFTGWGPVDPKTHKPIPSRKGEYFKTWIAALEGLGFKVEWKKLNAADYGDATTRQRFILMGRSDGKRIVWPIPTHAKRPRESEDLGTLALFPGIEPWRPAREIIDWTIKGRSIFGRKASLAPKTLDRVLAGALKFGWPAPFVARLLQELERSLISAIRRGFENRHKRKKDDKPGARRAAVRRDIKRLCQLRIDPVTVREIGGAQPILITLRNHANGSSIAEPIATVAAEGTHIGLAEPVLIKQNFRRDVLGVDQPAPTIMTEARIGLVEPVVVNVANGNEADEKSPNDRRVKSADEPLGTVHAGGGNFGIAEAVIVRTNMHGRKSPGARGASDPLMTFTTDGGIAVAEPFVLSQQNSGQPRSTETEPLPTITTGGAGTGDHPGCARPMLVEAFVLNRHGDNGGTRAHPVDDPLPTSDCRGAGYVVEPFLLSRQGEGAPRSTDEPTPTQCAKHSHVLITSYYGASTSATSAEDPLPTVTTKDRFGMVVPVTHSLGGNQARDVDEPVPTMTTAKGGEFALVIPVTHAGEHRARDPNEEPLQTVTGANRGELAIITAQHGEREGQAPRIHSVDDPAPTIAATGHIDLATAIITIPLAERVPSFEEWIADTKDYGGSREEYDRLYPSDGHLPDSEHELSNERIADAIIGAVAARQIATAIFDGANYDIMFRMLEPHELAAAMGFTTEDAAYEFAGTKTEQIKQIGNAVSVRKMQACVAAIMADASPKNRAAEATPPQLQATRAA